MDLQYRYLIVGGGMTADAAVAGIRNQDPDGPIALLSEEPFPPYNRPPLSKSLFKGDRVEQIWRTLNYGEIGVDLFLTTQATTLDPAAHTVLDSTGRVFHYERCLLATGGTPIRLRQLADVPALYYRSLHDYFWLQRHALNAREVAVVGGGFIGSEMAAALTLQKKHVHQIVPEAGLLGRVLPDELAANVADYYREQGVEVHTATSVTGARQEGSRTRLVTDHGELAVDLVVAGVGIRPRTELAERAGIQIGDGIEVDQGLMTSAPDVYAAGDVASVYSRPLGRHWRVEHEDNANVQGETAGRIMAGATAPFDYLPFFYSDLFDLGFEAVGRVDSRLAAVADWADPFRNGIVYYLDDGGHVDGVLLWNAWERVDRARALIESRQVFTQADAVRGQISLED